MFAIMGLLKETVNFLNPILYITRNSDFWLAAKNVLSCKSKSHETESKIWHEGTVLKTSTAWKVFVYGVFLVKTRKPPNMDTFDEV